MGTSIAQKFYNAAPQSIQTLILNGYALKIHRERYGRDFMKACHELSRTQYFGKQEIENYQNALIKKLIAHSYESVPFYREQFQSRGLRPKDVETVDDLKKLPILTKEMVKKNTMRLISTRHRRRNLVRGHTSGTTGSPLDVCWDKNTCVYTNAVDWRQKNWAGVRYRDRIALVLGRTVVPVAETRPPFWRMNFLHNQLWLSAFHMNDANLIHYIAKLERFRPAALEGYPSTMYILARYLTSKGRMIPMKAVFTSSETLYPVQRECIESAFNCRVFDFYGLAERVVFASECEVHSGHHLNFEYGVTEIVDKEGNRVPDGTPGFVVSTGLRNYGMPLIRYRTSDRSSIIQGDCSCGRSMPRIEDVTTKAEDIIVRPDGRLISPSVLTHPFKPMHNLEKSQVIQEDLHNIVIKIVRGPGYREADTVALLASFRERVGGDITVRVEYVDDIPSTAAGKYRWVISHVKKDLK